MKIILGTDEIMRVYRSPSHTRVELTDGSTLMLSSTSVLVERYFDESRPSGTYVSDEELARQFRSFNRIPLEAARTVERRPNDNPPTPFSLYRYRWIEITSPDHEGENDGRGPAAEGR